MFNTITLPDEGLAGVNVIFEIMTEYQQFLEGKKHKIEQSGFDIDESQLNASLFPFQKFIVKRALKAGKYAIFADCGLGKSLMQIEWANHVQNETGSP